MASYGHRVLIASPDDIRRLWTVNCGQRVTGVRCGERITHLTCYSYVTGRAGRTTEARKGRCQAHAERFAKRWKIDMPTRPNCDDSFHDMAPDSSVPVCPTCGMGIMDDLAVQS